MALRRGSGVLLHPTSLPGPDGIGDLGEGAFRFVDWLARAGQRYWQIMPLVPTGFGDSPYSSPSAFAINPDLVSLDRLEADGWLHADEREREPLGDHAVQFSAARERKRQALETAFRRFSTEANDEQRGWLDSFRSTQSAWLDDYALFMALKAEHGGAAWSEWVRELSRRDEAALTDARRRLHDRVELEIFVQWVLREQWSSLRRYANERDIRLIGDIPIFVALDSADVWANPETFRLDEERRPTALAGVPPDYFSETGQLWGNPLYDWQSLQASDYRWWADRFRVLLEQVDVVRIDHFRAFAANWSVPAGAESAAGGQWERGPGADLFQSVERQLGEIDIIVEDLGLITADVVELRDEIGLPGMAVLQFAFDGDPLNRYLPHMYPENSVVYTGTHDNQTTVGWFGSQPEQVREQVRGYLGSPVDDPAWELLRAAHNSVARVSIVPMQDILRLGDEARLNTPGKPEGNWSWRMRWDQLDEGLAAGLAHLSFLSGRTVDPAPQTDFDSFDYTAPGTRHPLADQPLR